MLDAARLWRAQIDNLFQPVKSRLLESRIAADLQGKNQIATQKITGPRWL